MVYFGSSGAHWEQQAFPAIAIFTSIVVLDKSLERPCAPSPFLCLPRVELFAWIDVDLDLDLIAPSAV